MQVATLAAHSNGTIGRFLGNRNLLQPFGDLWIQLDMPVTGLFGNNPAKSLVEPAPHSIEAIVKAASGSIPMLPCTGSTVIDHVEVARITVLLEHSIQPIALPRQGCPFCYDRYSDQTGLEMTVIDSRSPIEKLVPYLFNLFIGNDAHKQRIDHINLGTATVDVFFRIEQCLIDTCGKGFIPRLVSSLIFRVSYKSCDSPKFFVNLTE